MPPYGIPMTETRPPAGADPPRSSARGRCAWQLPAAIMLVVAACDPASSPTRHRGTPIVVDDTLLSYPDGSTLAVGLRDLELIGQLPALTAPPFVIVAGRECDQCDEQRVLLVRSPADGALTPRDAERARHPYPGSVISDADGRVRSYARVFQGDCLPQRAPVVLSYRTDFAAPGDAPHTCAATGG